MPAAPAPLLALPDAARAPRVALADRGMPPPGGVDGDGSGRFVLVPVGELDRRALVAADFATHLPAMAHALVHVATDARALDGLRSAWAESALSVVPLHILEDDGGVATTIAELARQLLIADAVEVIVVAGRLSMSGFARRLLHDRTADAIAREVRQIDGAHAILLRVPVEL